MVIKLLEKIEESFSEVDKCFDEETMLNFLSDGYSQVYRYNFVQGMKIRKELLEDGKELHTLFIGGGIINKEDMSQLILQLFYSYTIGEYPFR